MPRNITAAKNKNRHESIEYLVREFDLLAFLYSEEDWNTMEADERFDMLANVNYTQDLIGKLHNLGYTVKGAETIEALAGYLANHPYPDMDRSYFNRKADEIRQDIGRLPDPEDVELYDEESVGELLAWMLSLEIRTWGLGEDRQKIDLSRITVLRKVLKNSRCSGSI